METNLRKTALTLDKLLKVAKYVTYGVMVSAIICIFLGYECNIGNLVDIMEAEAQYAHGRSAIGVVLFPIFILCFIQKKYEYLTSFLLQYIIEFVLCRKCHPEVNSEIMKNDWIIVVSIIIHSDR